MTETNLFMGFIVGIIVGCIMGVILGFFAFDNNEELKQCYELEYKTCTLANGLIDVANKQSEIINQCYSNELKDLGIVMPNMTKLLCGGLVDEI